MRLLPGAGDRVHYRPLPDLLAAAGVDIAAMPYSLRTLAESTQQAGRPEVSFRPARVLLQDFSGVPVLLDLASLRREAAARGLDPLAINPSLRTDLVVDHSLRVEAFGSASAPAHNLDREYEANRERYRFLGWAQQAFDNLRVIPPGRGIVHQINLEVLSDVVTTTLSADGRRVATVDTVLGTDSHTTMVNALGVLGWGVGGLEAEIVLLGDRLTVRVPEVVGVRLHGAPRPGVLATDLVLALTAFLRQAQVVGSFVEFCGDGVGRLSTPDRATIANMAPDYGATAAFFPVDGQTLRYLRDTARPAEQVDLVERFCKEQGLFAGSGEPTFGRVLDFDLGAVGLTVAGPYRPDQRLGLDQVRASVPAPAVRRSGAPRLADGSVLLAAITSCTNTANPDAMLTAGLVAAKAAQRGMTVPGWVKTSFAPGSRTVVSYLAKAGLLEPLEQLGFSVVGFGCATCHGMSGPLTAQAADAVVQDGLVGVAVLSGNRNFEGRIHPQVKANYLASPPLVVAYALAGTVDIDLAGEPVGVDADGRQVGLADLWPTAAELRAARQAVTADLFAGTRAQVLAVDERWQQLLDDPQPLFDWPESTYIQPSPFVARVVPADPIVNARAIVMLGHAVSTDHVSPVGAIPADSPAGEYLRAGGVAPAALGSYGTRRGDAQVMARGTFANPHLRNMLAGDRVGAWTVNQLTGELGPIYDTAVAYRAAGVPLVVVAGRDYGCGSARDWAAKGPALLGVRAVIAESFERIHRANLASIGILPLEFVDAADRAALTGRERIDIPVPSDLRPGQEISVVAGSRAIRAVVRLDTEAEVDWYRSGGAIPDLMRRRAGG